MPTVVFSKDTKITREIIVESFQKENIDARVFYWPLSSFPMFTSKNKNLVARDISSRSINLPSYFDITDEDQNRVIKVIQKLITSNRK